ncbi:MAG TPA: hypothetical protein DDZ88_05685 [Verrucomicrobiales bacterium]|nr:hypothetical protein [Verrucomicrobiales bacterium]
MIAPDASISGTSWESLRQGSYPTDAEISLLAFKHWKMEGGPHLRPEHWLKAEKKLLEAYSGHESPSVATESEGLEEFWEKQTETISGFAHHHCELNL